MRVVTGIFCELPDSYDASDLVPGVVVRLLNPTVGGPTMMGQEVPLLSLDGSGRAFGIIDITQGRVEQKMLDFKVVWLQVVVCGRAKTFFPLSNPDGRRYDLDGCSARVVSLWIPSFVPSTETGVKAGDTCAEVYVSSVN